MKGGQCLAHANICSVRELQGQELKEMSSVGARTSRAWEGGGLTALRAWSSGSRRPPCLVGNRTEEERWGLRLGTSSFSSLERPFLPPAPDHAWGGPYLLGC